MAFEALRDEDLTNLAAINRCYLDIMGGGDAHGARQLARLEPSAREMLRRLGSAAREEVARCPFLLCSLREVDPGRGAAAPATLELFRGTTPTVELVLYMSLSMLRRIARRRPFAARLLGGVDAGWCEELLALDDPRIALLARAQAARVRPVHAGVAGFWTELLQCGELGPARRRAIRAAGLQLQQRLCVPARQRAAASRVQATRGRTAGQTSSAR